MDEIKELLGFYNNFLASRGIKEFDSAKMLCQYQISDTEYEELKSLLSQIRLNRYTVKTIAAPLFVLYSSENWRREYEGGVWSWNSILTSIGQDDISIAIRQDLVKLGFRLLKRKGLPRRIGNHTRYLGSIACESGIPQNLLNDTGSNVVNVLKEVFMTIVSATSNTETIEFAKKIINTRLPQIYRNEYFYMLIAEFASSLAELAKRFPLGEQENPLLYLDDVDPNWKDSFPLAVDEINANFFQNLLSNVVEVTRSVTRLQVKYYIKENKGVCSLYYQLALRDSVCLPDVFGLTKEDLDKLSTRFILAKEVAGKAHHLAYFDKVGDGDRFRAENIEKTSVPVSFVGEERYYLTDFDGDVMIELNLEVIDFSTCSAPLIFHQGNEGWKLKALGSAKFKECTYRVLVPADVKLSTSVTELNFVEPSFKLFETTSNDCSVEYQDGSLYKIGFSKSDSCNRYEWIRKGVGLSFAPNENKSIFIGLPRLVKYNSVCFYLRSYDCTDSRMEFFLDSSWKKGLDQSDFQKMVGRVKVRLMEDQVVSFSSWISILPEGFSLKFNGKTINLKNLPLNTGISIDNTEFKIEDHTLHYLGNESGFASMSLQSTLSKPLKVKFPLPVGGDYFTNDGEVLVQQSRGNYSKMDGIRLCVVNMTESEISKSVSFFMKKQNISMRKKISVSPYSVKQIPLLTYRNEISQLLGLANNNDALLALKIEGIANFNLYKYDDRPHFSEELDSYIFPQGTSNVMAFRLDEDFDEEKVRKFPVGAETRMLEDLPGDGLWFIYPPDDCEVFFRPVALNNNAQLGSDEVPSVDWPLSKLSLVSDNYKRHQKIRAKLKRIAIDFNDQEWVKNLLPLSEYFKTSKLTLSSLDVWKLAAQSDTIMAGLFFMASNEFIYQFTNEFVVIWRKVAMAKWKIAYEEFIKRYGVDSFVLGFKMEQKATLFNQFELGSVLSILQNETSGYGEQMLINLLDPVANDFEGGTGYVSPLNKLRRNHSPETRWPKFLQINTWIDQCKLDMNNPLLTLLNQGPPTERTIRMLPVVFAYSCANGINLEDLEMPASRWKIIEARSFDTEWYKEIYDIFLSYYSSNNTRG